jgi:hypothetical protein
MERLVPFIVIIYKCPECDTLISKIINIGRYKCKKCKKFRITGDKMPHEIKMLYKDIGPIIKLKKPILDKVHKRTLHQPLENIEKSSMICDDKDFYECQNPTKILYQELTAINILPKIKTDKT